MINIELADHMSEKYGWSDELKATNLAIYNRQRPVIDKPVVEFKRINLQLDKGIDIMKTWTTTSRVVRGGHSQLTCGSIKHKRAKIL